MDGNKRTACAAVYTFLAINGGRLNSEADATYVFVLPLYETRGFRFDVLVPWLREHGEFPED